MAWSHDTIGRCARQEPTTVLEDDVRSIFMQALEREPGRWDEFLDTACTSDAELRARVEELLQAHVQMGGFEAGRTPEAAEAATPVETPLLEGPGSMIGHLVGETTPPTQPARVRATRPRATNSRAVQRVPGPR